MDKDVSVTEPDASVNRPRVEDMFLSPDEINPVTARAENVTYQVEISISAKCWAPNTEIGSATT